MKHLRNIDQEEQETRFSKVITEITASGQSRERGYNNHGAG